MPNKLQLVIYRLSSIAPIAFVFSIVWYLQNGTWLVPVLCTGSGICLIVVFYLSFAYGKRQIAPITINVIEIIPSDNWLFGYIVSYMIPFASIAISDFNPLITLLISVPLVLVIPVINSASPHPLLLFWGYHFFSIGTENGVKDYVLISKQKLRNKNQVKAVKRWFEYLLLDERE